MEEEALAHTNLHSRARIEPETSLSTSLTYKNTKVMAKIEFIDECRAYNVIVDVNGETHQFPLSSPDIIYKPNVCMLHIHFFSTTAFVVYVTAPPLPLYSAHWAIGCFVQGPGTSFVCNVCYAWYGLDEIACIKNRLLVVRESERRWKKSYNGPVWTRCFDMESADLLWALKTDHLDYSLQVHEKEAEIIIGVLKLTVDERGVIDSSRNPLGVKWCWRYAGDLRGSWRTQPVHFPPPLVYTSDPHWGKPIL